MTLADLLFIVSFLAFVITVLRLAYFLVRRRIAAARSTAIWLACFVVVYGFNLVLVSLLAPQKVLAAGEEQCFDEWCITVAGVVRQPKIGDVPASGEFYIVTARVTSKSRGRRQRELDVYSYLTDSRGRRFEVSALGQAALHSAGKAGLPLISFVDPGGSFESRTAYDVPKDAKNLGFVKTSHGWFPMLFIIGDSSSLLHRPTVISLDSTPRS